MAKLQNYLYIIISMNSFLFILQRKKTLVPNESTQHINLDQTHIIELTCVLFDTIYPNGGDFTFYIDNTFSAGLDIRNISEHVVGKFCSYHENSSLHNIKPNEHQQDLIAILHKEKGATIEKHKA